MLYQVLLVVCLCIIMDISWYGWYSSRSVYYKYTFGLLFLFSPPEFHSCYSVRCSPQWGIYEHPSRVHIKPVWSYAGSKYRIIRSLQRSHSCFSFISFFSIVDIYGTFVGHVVVDRIALCSLFLWWGHKARVRRHASEPTRAARLEVMHSMSSGSNARSCGRWCATQARSMSIW